MGKEDASPRYHQRLNQPEPINAHYTLNTHAQSGQSKISTNNWWKSDNVTFSYVFPPAFFGRVFRFSAMKSELEIDRLFG